MLGREALREFIGHPRRIAWLVPRKLLIFFTPISYLGIDWMYLFLLPFAAFGGRYLWTRSELRSTLLFLCLPIVGVLAICVFTFSDVHFRHPVDPLIIIMASVGLIHLVELTGWPASADPRAAHGWGQETFTNNPKLYPSIKG